MFRVPDRFEPDHDARVPKGPRARAAEQAVRLAVFSMAFQGLAYAVLPIALEGGGRRPWRDWTLLGFAAVGALTTGAAATLSVARNLSTLAPWRIVCGLLPLVVAAALLSAAILKVGD